MSSPKILTAKGKSGKDYRFYLFAKDKDFDDIGNVGAVYLFLKYNIERNRYPILYVGQTSSISERMRSHEKWPCVKKHGCTHIAVMFEYCESDRLKIETDLRHGHSPVCNDQ